VAAVTVLAILAVAVGLLVLRSGGRPNPVAVGPQAGRSPGPSAGPSASPATGPTAAPAARPTPACTTAVGRFVPTAVSIPGVAREVSVIGLRRDRAGIPGVPPISRTGKTEMAFDLGSGIRPGDPGGNALLNAHTWPDGSALGNKLLAKLKAGGRIIVKGPLGRICYRVTDRVEVPVTDEGIRYYAKLGQPQIAIIVCSGRRLGPGRWTKRTMWFASPMA
jgi:hypothetical protein